MIARCKTCKWWQASWITAEQSSCTSPKLRLDGTSVAIGDEFRAGGFEGYGDYFTTGPDFGCVHHEPK